MIRWVSTGLVAVSLLLLVESCKMIHITLSDKRSPNVNHQVVDDQLTVTTWGAVKINKSHFFPASFQIKTSSQVIYIDPLLVETEEKADYIFITHSHPDHFSIKDIRKLCKEETVIICPHTVARKLSRHKCNLMEVRPGDTHRLNNDLAYEAMPAYNKKKIFLWIRAHPLSALNVGYLLTIGDLKIFHSGDTDYVYELKRVKDLDLVFVPIGGDKLTMNPEEAARFINEIKPRMVIPMHYELKEKSLAKHFNSLVAKKTSVVVMEQ